MKYLLLVIPVLLFAVAAKGQTRGYVLYNSKGKKVSFEKMAKKLVRKDIVLFGELHNNPIAHWLQLELALHFDKSRKLVLGAEMLEADNQQAVDDYLGKKIKADELKTQARLWPNFKTDYAPLVNLAREKNLRFIATNIPRRFANMVYKNGFGSLDPLSAEEKSWIAPLPIPFDSELPTYKNFLVSLGDHGSPELVMAQAMKDATMAHFILKNYRPGELFLHFNGSGHSDKYEGILWYIRRQNQSVKAGTISTVEQDNVNKLSAKNRGIADFIICVDSNMTKTF